MQAADGSERLEIADTGNPAKPLRPEAVSRHVQLTPFVFGAANVKRRGKAGASWQDNPASKPISNSEVCFWQLAAIIAGPWQPIAVWVALRAPLGGATLAVKFGGKDRVNE